MRSLAGALALLLATAGPGFAASALSWSAPRSFDPRPHGGALRWITDLECPSVSLCVALDHHSNIVTTTDPARGARGWQPAHIVVPNSGELFNVGCASPTLCVVSAGGGFVVSASNPSGGTPAWRVFDDGASNLAKLACPSPALCVTMNDSGRVVTSTDPFGLPTPTNPYGVSGPWLATAVVESDPNDGLAGIACPSVSLCVGVGVAGRVFYSTDPAGGAPAWKVRHLFAASDGGATSVSCPSPRLCVATSFGGRIATSTHPATGRNRWRFFRVGYAGLDEVSCPSTRLCVAVNGKGLVLTSTSPTAGRRAWHARPWGRSR